LGVGRHIEVAARHGEVGFVRAQQREALGRSIGRDRGEPDRAALSGEALRQRLNEPLIVAVRRANRDPQGLRPQRIIKRARRGHEHEYSDKQDQKREPLSLLAKPRGSVQVLGQACIHRLFRLRRLYVVSVVMSVVMARCRMAASIYGVFKRRGTGSHGNQVYVIKFTRKAQA